jgi:2Fe-2S ferredoxin
MMKAALRRGLASLSYTPVSVSLVGLNGDVVSIPNARAGSSLLEVAQANGFGDDEMEGICGGNCECATCHVYVDEPHFSLLEEQDEDETDTLDASVSFTPIKPNSRLACQIKITSLLDGLVATVAPNNWEHP